MTAPLADRSGQARYEVATDRYRVEADNDELWVSFAIVLLSIAGVLNTIAGFAAVGDSKVFTHRAHYIFGNLHSWGWTVAIIGIAQLLIAVGVYRRNQLARWLGVFSLTLNAIGMLLMLPAYPFWSLCVFALDLIALFGLIVHGQKVPESS